MDNRKPEIIHDDMGKEHDHQRANGAAKFVDDLRINFGFDAGTIFLLVMFPVHSICPIGPNGAVNWYFPVGYGFPKTQLALWFETRPGHLISSAYGVFEISKLIFRKLTLHFAGPHHFAQLRFKIRLGSVYVSQNKIPSRCFQIAWETQVCPRFVPCPRENRSFVAKDFHQLGRVRDFLAFWVLVLLHLLRAHTFPLRALLSDRCTLHV
mmetsp:Transcript_9255/g.17983  ORF Transcript_9255/g.17983 Transcript_9255/m.17983 type:complete len:209 (-) Transcript_9255:52-678(-)